MEKFSEIYSEYKSYIMFLLLLAILLIVSGLLFYHFESSFRKLKKEMQDRPVIEVNNKTSKTKELIVDIKGEVKKPGVYFLDDGKRVIDVVNKAGGFTRSADTSANNLSMKLKDEMVIVIYSKNEIKKYLETKEKENNVKERCQNDKVNNGSCISSINGEEVSNTSSTTKTSTSTNASTSKSNSTNKSNSSNDTVQDTKISLNTATKEQLMTLAGIGESKAIAIIEYRQNKKFETIEEIKEVSGIGESLFEKIKDNITT